MTSRVGRPSSWPPDGVVAVLCAAVAFAYVWVWPHDLMSYDEGLFLYEPKRILDGDVMYRDIFEIVTPGAWYLLALCYAVFGVDMATARGLMGVLHGVTVAMVYLACRALGVRRSLSITAAAMHLALAFSVLPHANPHWLTTALMMVLVVVLETGRPTRASARAFVVGAIAAMMVGVQQQRGMLLLVGALVALLVQRRLARRQGRELGYFVLGMAAVLVPLAVAVLVPAGIGPVWAALVEFPLFHYRGYHRGLPGLDQRLQSRYSYPLLLEALPLLIPLALARSLLASDSVRPARAALGIMSLAAVASVAYLPDVIHLAFVAPIFFVLAADTLEWLLHRLPRGIPSAVAAALLVALAMQSVGNLERRRLAYPHTLQTAFGRVEFQTREEPTLIENVRTVMRDDPSRELLCYPHCAGLYLTTGTNNPTPYQLLIPGYTRDDQIADALATLEAKRVRYVVAYPLFVKWASDPLAGYLTGRYQRVDMGLKGFVAPMLFRRIDGAPTAPK